MAIVNVTKKSTGKPNHATEYTYQAVAAGDTVKVLANYKDLHTVIHFKGGANASDITVKAGNGYAGVNDYVFSVGASKYMAVVLDSARFMNVTGADRGYIVIQSSAACDIAVLEMGVPAQIQPNA